MKSLLVTVTGTGGEMVLSKYREYCEQHAVEGVAEFSFDREKGVSTMKVSGNLSRLMNWDRMFKQQNALLEKIAVMSKTKERITIKTEWVES